MKLEKLTYRRLFPTGNFANEAIEITGNLEPNEDIMQAYTELYEMAKSLHYSKNKEYYEQTGMQVRDIKEVNNAAEIDNEYKQVIEKLETFEFREDAEEFLQTTSYRLEISAKKIVNNKPLKNK